MHVQPTRPTTILLTIQTLVCQILDIPLNRVFIAPDPALLGRLSPAPELFAAVVLRGVRFETSPQHPGCYPAILDLDICLYSRVAIDRPLDAMALMTHADRGLLSLSDRLLEHMSGHELPTQDGLRLLRGPLVCSGLQPIRWGEASNLILAYLTLSWQAPFEFQVGR